MLSTIIQNPIIIGIVAISILIWILMKWNEYETKLKCRQRNLSYVNVPNVFWSLITRRQHAQRELDLNEKHGYFYGCNIMNKFTIVLTHPELVQIVCNKEFTNFSNRRVILD